MRLLFVTPRLPYPPNRGGEIIIFNLLRQLSARHDLALVSFYDDEAERGFRDRLAQYCSRVELVRRPGKLQPGVLLQSLFGRSYSMARHSSAALGAAVARVVREWRPDVVQLETFAMAAYLPQLNGTPAVMHMHDVAWVMWERMAQVAPIHLRPLVRTEARRIRANELAGCGAVQACVNVSALDRARLLEAGVPGEKVRVVLPGVDRLEPVQPPHGSANLVFVGSMSYVPNVDAVTWFVREVLPLVAAAVPDVTFTIVGARPSAAVQRLAQDPRVRVTGRVDDVRPYYAAAAAAVVPLRFAGGVRLKILEAMALGMPVVSTTIGAEGLDLESGRDLLIADSPARIAEAAIGLLRDAALGERLGAQARQTALRRFSWERVAAEFEAVYHAVKPWTH